MRKSLEDRLSSIESRLISLEAGKNIAKFTRDENVLSLVGLSFLLKHLNEKIMAHPHFDGYDDYLKGIFKTEITPENRLEYADKVMKISFSLLDDALDNYKRRKK
jgi:hypothetical protein